MLAREPRCGPEGARASAGNGSALQAASRQARADMRSRNRGMSGRSHGPATRSHRRIGSRCPARRDLGHQERVPTAAAFDPDLRAATAFQA